MNLTVLEKYDPADETYAPKKKLYLPFLFIIFVIISALEESQEKSKVSTNASFIIYVLF